MIYENTSENTRDYGRRSFAFLSSRDEAAETDQLRSKDVQRHQKESSQRVQTGSQGVQDGSESSSQEVQNEFSEHFWSLKAAKNAEKKRHGALKMTFFIFLFTCSAYLTMQGYPFRIQTCAYMCAAAVFVLTDPFEAMDRFLAPQTRVIIASLIIMAVANFIRPNNSFGIVTLICVLFGIFISRCLNKKWLAAHNWLMSAEVQKALRVDPEHTAAQAWRAHGRRETRTLLYELGFDVYDDILDAMHKPVYYCGYLHGLKKESELRREAEKLAVELDKKDDRFEELEEQLRLKQVEINQAEKNAISESSEAAKWRVLYEKELEKSKALEKANEELLAGIPDPEEFMNQKEQISELSNKTKRERVIECLEAGMAPKDICRIVNCSKSYVSGISKELSIAS